MIYSTTIERVVDDVLTAKATVQVDYDHDGDMVGDILADVIVTAEFAWILPEPQQLKEAGTLLSALGSACSMRWGLADADNPMLRIRRIVFRLGRFRHIEQLATYAVAVASSAVHAWECYGRCLRGLGGRIPEEELERLNDRIKCGDLPPNEAKDEE